LWTCRFPIFHLRPEWDAGIGTEVTRLNSRRQFKPFIYLNGGGRRTTLPFADLLALHNGGKVPQKKNPAFRRDFPVLFWFGAIKLPVAVLFLALLSLALTIRILLLLAGLGATALLLPGFLAWILVLLARVLVLVRHQRSPLLDVSPGQRQLRR
jgi:hypothetical protein